jgi:hypothetical protein
MKRTWEEFMAEYEDQPLTLNLVDEWLEELSVRELVLTKERLEGCNSALDIAAIIERINYHIMLRPLLILILCALSLSARAGEIGWSLEQCRQHFGPEYALADRNVYAFYSREGTAKNFDMVFLTFDPDGTVGRIQWSRVGQAFSEAEIQRHLREASDVEWQRFSPQGEGALQWLGVQHGKVIFEASETEGRDGVWMLTIQGRGDRGVWK